VRLGYAHRGIAAAPYILVRLKMAVYAWKPPHCEVTEQGSP
jgi:hypothetical protein